jgi:hypothetical protein
VQYVYEILCEGVKYYVRVCHVGMPELINKSVLCEEMYPVLHVWHAV